MAHGSEQTEMPWSCNRGKHSLKFVDDDDDNDTSQRRGSHTFNDKKIPGLLQDFPGPSKRFSRTLSEPANI